MRNKSLRLIFFIFLLSSLSNPVQAFIFKSHSDIFKPYCGIQVIKQALLNLKVNVSKKNSQFSLLKKQADQRLGNNTLYELREAANKLNLNVRSFKLDIEALKELSHQGQVIVNTTYNRHFCLVERVSDTVVDLYIPGVNYEHTQMRWEEFQSYWNGAALVVSKDKAWINPSKGVFLALSDEELHNITGGADCGNTSGGISSYNGANGSGRTSTGNGAAHGDSPSSTVRTPQTTSDPVNVNNGNLFLVAPDVTVPTVGLPLNLTRYYNAQIISEVPGWTSDPGAGSWAIENGEFSGQGDRTTTDEVYDNFTLELDMQTLQPGSNFPWETAWVDFRYTARTDDPRKPLDTYYFLIKTDGQVELSKFQNGAQYFLTSASTGYLAKNKNHIKIVATNSLIRIYVNNVLVINYNDSFPILGKGRIGLEAYFSHAHFDNISIAHSLGTTAYNFSADDNSFIFGYGWTHSYGLRIKAYTNHVTLFRENNDKEIYVPQTDGSFKSFPTSTFDQLTKDTTGFSLRSKKGPHYRFNLNGILLYIQDRNLNKTSLTYAVVGGRNVPISITEPTGRKLSLGYGANGMVSQVSDPTGQIINYYYDTAKRLIKVIDRDGNISQYKYDAVTNNLIQYIDPLSHVYKYAYKYNDRVTEQIDPLGQKTLFDYFWDTVHVINQRGEIYKYNFDANLFVQSVADPLNRIKRTVNDQNGNVLDFYDSSGVRTQYSYDANGNVTKIIDGLGQTKSFVYTLTLNLPTSITNEAGKVTSFQYDSKGNLIKMTDAQGQITTFAYNSLGRRTRMTDPKGNIVIYSYDSYGNLTQVSDGEGNNNYLFYDLLGRVIKITDPLGRNTEFTYNKNGLLLTVKDPAGHLTKNTYNALGLLSTSTDALNRITTFAYDLLGNRNRIRLPDNRLISLVYDTTNKLHLDRSLLTQVVDSKNNTTSYEYDALDRLVRTIDPQGRAFTYTYGDAAGNLTQRIDPRGYITNYSYDVLGRVVNQEYSMGAAYPVKWRNWFAYDPIGQIESLGNWVDSNVIGNQMVFTYDDLGRKKSETVMTPGLGDVVKNWTYDPNGNRASFEIVGRGKTSYSYDKADRLMSETLPNGKSIAFTYDPASQRTLLNLANQTRTTYLYDPLGQISEIAHLNPDNSILSKLNFTYNAVGHQQSIDELGRGLHAYGYDVLDQLVSATYPGGHAFANTSWQYDAMGNRTFMSLPTSTTGYTTNTLNQYSKVSTTDYTYDANGNLINDGILSYEYDGENHLVRAYKTGLDISFAYDALGRRISRSIVGSTVTHYYYDGERVVLDKYSSGTIVAEYDYGTGIDEVLSMRKGVNTYYYHADALGSVKFLTDTNRTVVEQYAYDAFGQVQIKNATGQISSGSPLGNRYLYTGREYEANLKLYHYRARAYNPRIGRFLQRDPIGFGDDFNMYRYVGNNPVNMVDPFGLEGSKGGFNFWNDIIVGDSYQNQMMWDGVYENGYLWTPLVAISFGVPSLLSKSVGVAGRITGYTWHGIEQAIGRDGGKGVSIKSILDAVRNPKKTLKQDNGTIKFVGDDATVILNDSGKVVTTYGKPRN